MKLTLTTDDGEVIETFDRFEQWDLNKPESRVYFCAELVSAKTVFLAMKDIEDRVAEQVKAQRLEGDLGDCAHDDG